MSYFLLLFDSFFEILDVNSTSNSQKNMTGKIKYKQDANKASSDNLHHDILLGSQAKIKRQQTSSNSVTCESIKRPETFHNGSSAPATINENHVFVLQEPNLKEDNEGDNDVSPCTPFVPVPLITSPNGDSKKEVVTDTRGRKKDAFATTATVLVATTRLKSCLRNPLRKKHKNSDTDTEGNPCKILKKKQSKRHICWETENAENLIQNEEDGRGMSSKILNMAIVASGPAFLHGGGYTSRRSSNPETPKVTNSTLSFDFVSQERKASLSIDPTTCPSSTMQGPGLNINQNRRRSSVMVSSLVKSLSNVGKYRPSFGIHSSSRPKQPSMLHNIMASATTYTSTTVLTTTSISETTTTNIDPTLISHSVFSQHSASNSFANLSNRSNSRVHKECVGNIENVNDIIREAIDSPTPSLKSCPASVPRRRKRSTQSHNLNHRYERRRPSIHDEVVKARGKGILSPRFLPRNRFNGINQQKNSHDLKAKKRSPRRIRSRRNSIRNASNNNLKSICT